MSTLLSINNLSVGVGAKTLVHNVSFDVPTGKIVAIAGGSGSGKTTIGLSILRLLPSALSLKEGSIVFEGRNVLELSAEGMRQLRGARIGMVFQEPLSAFDPLFTIGQQLDEVLVAHTALSKAERHKRIIDTLSEVELPDLSFYFKSSLRYGLSSLDTLVRESAAELGLESSEVREYLTENLSFFLRRDEIDGLEEFYRRAYNHGLILEPKPIEWRE